MPENIFDLPKEEQLSIANAGDVPSLLILAGGAKMRVFPPADFVKSAIRDGNVLPLLIALATRQIDYLPWEAVAVDENDGFTRALQPIR